MAEILRPVALPVGEVEAPGLAGKLRVPCAPRRFLALLTACHRVGDGNLVGGWRCKAAIVGLEDALVAVGVVDDVAGGAGGVNGGGALNNGQGLGGGRGDGLGSGPSGGEGQSNRCCRAGGGGGRGSRFGGSGGGL